MTDIVWSQRVSALELFGNSGSCVYGWFRGNYCLYIGCSSNGWQRILGHNKIGKVEPFTRNDEIRFIWMNDVEAFSEILKLESILIEKYRPKHNGDGGYYPVKSSIPTTEKTCRCGRRYKPSEYHWWRKTCSRKCLKLNPTHKELLDQL